MKNAILVIVLVALGAAVYCNSLEGKLMWDDEYLIKYNTFVHSPSYIPNIFTENIGKGSSRFFGFYRPLQMMTYVMDYSLWELDERGYHITSVAFHILAGLGLFWLLNVLFGNSFLSFFTSALFLVHPVNTGAVSYIAGRADPMAVLFMMLAFVFYVKTLERKEIPTKKKSRIGSNLPYFSLMVVSYISALLSKEMSLILPFLILLYHFSFGKKINTKSITTLFVITVVYLILRTTALKHTMMATETYRTDVFQRFPGFFMAFLSYLRLLVVPVDLHTEYGNALFSSYDPRAIAGVILIVAFIVAAFLIKKKNKIVFFGMAWFFVCLLPVSNLYPINAYMAEHWLYLPAIGIFLVVAHGLDVLRKKAIKSSRGGLNLPYCFVMCIAAGLLALYSYFTIEQNKTWREPILFYERTLKYAPRSMRVLNDLGRLYAHKGRDEDAIKMYRNTIKVAPNYPLPYNNLAVIYHKRGNDAEAIKLYKKAIGLDPFYADALNNIGVSYSALGNTEEAIKYFKRAIEAHPGFVGAYQNLGNLYKQMGDAENAKKCYKKAAELGVKS